MRTDLYKEKVEARAARARQAALQPMIDARAEVVRLTAEMRDEMDTGANQDLLEAQVEPFSFRNNTGSGPLLSAQRPSARGA